MAENKQEKQIERNSKNNNGESDEQREKHVQQLEHEREIKGDKESWRERLRYMERKK